MTVDPQHVDPPAIPAAQQPAAYPAAAPVPALAAPAAPVPALALALPHARMLAANADRERAVDVLRASYAEGRLTKAEHDDRVNGVYASRTYGELAALTADLPIGPVPLPPAPVSALAPQAAWRAAPMVDGAAIAALVCGILGLPTLGITAIPAVILGHAARRDIRQTGERGDGMATAGIVLGWTTIGILTVAFLIMALVVAAVANRGGGSMPAGPG